MSSLNALAIRRRLGRKDWNAPKPFGPDGWSFLHFLGAGSILITCASHDGDDWVHASIAWGERMPTYADLKMLHAAVFGDGWAYQVFAPPSDHVNIPRHTLPPAGPEQAEHLRRYEHGDGS